jgi:hypothetical protein
VNKPLNITAAGADDSRLEILWQSDLELVDLLLYVGDSNALIWEKQISVGSVTQQADLAQILKPLAELCYALYQSKNARTAIPEIAETLFDLRGLLHQIED